VARFPLEAARVAGATRAVVREAVMELISAPFLSSSRSFQPLPLEQWRHKTPLITGKDKISQVEQRSLSCGRSSLGSVEMLSAA